MSADLQAVERDGYVVMENLIDAAACAEIKREAKRLVHHTGSNPFEGLNTQRVYNVLAKTRALDELADHPRVMALMDGLFLPNYLLSQLQMINIRPGEAAQRLHMDDGFYPLIRPRPLLGAATIWAIDDFTAENGATVVVPGSHKWVGERAAEREEARPVVMPAGSCVFFLGTLWHGGGENRSNADRLAATCQYCQPWLRQQENFFLEVPPDTVRALRPKIQSMMGYSIHGSFMGFVDRHHPLKVLN